MTKSSDTYNFLSTDVDFYIVAPMYTRFPSRSLVDECFTGAVADA
jgi:hypothetical protein